MSIQLIKRVKRPVNLNAVYGLEYRCIGIKLEDYTKLRTLKERTGIPMTELAARAIAHFIEQAEVMQ